MEQELAKYDGWDVKIMRAVAQGESNCHADATGDMSLTYEQNGRTYGYSVGALQVRILPGREDCDSHSLEVNVACAHRIWQTRGYSAWSVHKSGKYLQFVNK